MRALAGALVVLLVVLAGCSVGYQPFDDDSPTGTETSPDATPTTPGPTADAPVSPPDPETDVLGWEEGYWANETLAIDRDDGLNETERRAVVARAMARVEALRGLEFDERVPVEIVSRSEYLNRSTPGEATPAFRRFDNAKFEAMFLVGEQNDSLAVQSSTRGSSVLGFYSPRNDTIVIVAEGETPDLPGERTLGHELVHALQDQHFDLTSYRAATRMQYNAQNGLIEGDANLVQSRYEQRCGGEWECLPAPSAGGGGGEFHLGIYVLEYFPYSDGPGFVQHYYDRGGWDRVNELFADVPASDEQIIYPEKYETDPPTDVALPDAATNGWERVRPEARTDASPRPDYASLGQSGLTATFAYTLYDSYNPESVVEPRSFLNVDGGRVDPSDPFNYDLAYTSGWDGDRLHVYEKDGETAYVWKIAWDAPAEAEEFATGYRALLRHYGAEPVENGSAAGDSGTVHRIDDGPYADAFRVTVRGDTVTIVNAPTVGDLDDVRAPGEAG